VETPGRRWKNGTNLVGAKRNHEIEISQEARVKVGNGLGLVLGDVDADFAESIHGAAPHKTTRLRARAFNVGCRSEHGARQALGKLAAR
jgi:hypothetical protein